MSLGSEFLDKVHEPFRKITFNSASAGLFKEMLRLGILHPTPVRVHYSPCNQEEMAIKDNVLKNTSLSYRNLEWKDKVVQSLCKVQAMRLIKGTDLWNFKPNSSSKILNLEILIMIKKMYFHRELLYKKGLLPLEDYTNLLRRNLLEGPKFSLAKKKSADYSIREKLTLVTLLQDEEVEILPVEDIDHMFPSRHYIPFLHERDVSDVEHSFEPVKIKPSLDSLKELMGKNLKKEQHLFSFNDLDAICLCSKTKCISNQKKDTNARLRSDKGFPNQVEKDYMKYEISCTTKSADEIRTIPIPDIYTRNLQHCVREACNTIMNHKFDVYGKPRWNFENWLSKGHERFFILTDQKKSGWTFPMELMASFFEVASTFYPDFEEFKIMERIFKEKRLLYYLDNEERRPERGFAIGIWDNVMSFILANLFELFIETRFKDDYELENVLIDGKFWGDDQAIRLDHSDIDQARIVRNRWIDFMTKYGMKINLKKSFLSDHGVLCEVYTQNSETISLQKGALFVLMPFDSWRGVNTFHQKTLFIGFKDQIERAVTWFSRENREAIEAVAGESLALVSKVISYEFAPEEIHLPHQLGGWEIKRDADNEPDFLSYLLESDHIGEKWLRVGLYNPSKRRMFSIKNRKLIETILNTPFVNGLAEFLSDDLLGCSCGFDLSGFLENQRLTNVKTVDEDRIWHEMASDRQRAYRDNSLRVSIQSFLNKKFIDKDLQIERLTPNLLYKGGSANIYPGEQEPTGRRITGLTPERAKLFLYKRCNKNNIYNFSVTGESHISTAEIIAHIYPDIAFNDQWLPYLWYLWASEGGLDLGRLKLQFERDFWPQKLFDFDPPFRTEKMNKFMNSNFGEAVIFWDKRIGIPIVLFHGDTYNLYQGENSRNWLIANNLEISIDEYLLNVEDRSSKEPYPSSLTAKRKLEDEQFPAEYEELYENLKRKRTETISDLLHSVQLIGDINDIEDVLDSEPEEEAESGEDSDEEPLAKYLRDAGLENTDLFGMEALDDYYQDENPDYNYSPEGE